MFRMFDFECQHCSHKFEKLIKRNELPDCPMCGYYTKRLPPVVSVNMGVGAYGYFDETLDKYVGTNKARKEEMRKQGVTPKGDTPKVQGDAWV